MTRDIENITRYFDEIRDDDSSDIVWKKSKLEEMFLQDPDLMEILGQKEKKPYIEGMTDAEKKEVDEYNEKITHPQIVKWLKLNGMQKEVLNFIMFDVQDVKPWKTNDVMKIQYIIVMCMVHENDMDTEYGIPRADLLGYIVKDLLNRSNCFGMHLKCVSDLPAIIDSKYYCRTLKFRMDELDLPIDNAGKTNRYDRLP